MELNFVESINCIKSVSSTNGKGELLKELLTNCDPKVEIFLDDIHNLNYAYYVSFDKVVEFKDFSQDEKWVGDFEELHELALTLRTRQVTGHASLRLLASFYHSVGESSRQLLKMLLDRSLDCGVGVKTVNKYLKNKIPVFELMLCTPSSEKAFAKIDFNNATIQKKHDGMRIVICVAPDGNVEYRTRNGLVFNINNPEIDNYFAQIKGYVLDGEMFFKENGKALDRKASNGIANKVIKGTKTSCSTNEILFIVWDLIRYEDFFKGYSPIKYRVREKECEVLVDTINQPFLEMTEGERIYSLEQALAYSDRMIKAKFEGAIVKNLEAPYRNDRVPDQVKLKQELSADLLCTGWIPGEGKYTGMIGALTYQDASGKVIGNVGSGLTDEDRAKDPSEFVNKIIEVVYNEVISKKNTDIRSLFLPRFINVRFDKTEPDLL